VGFRQNHVSCIARPSSQEMHGGNISLFPLANLSRVRDSEITHDTCFKTTRWHLLALLFRGTRVHWSVIPRAESSDVKQSNASHSQGRGSKDDNDPW
jgi:hypothetical protein